MVKTGVFISNKDLNILRALPNQEGYSHLLRILYEIDADVIDPETGEFLKEEK